MSAGRESIVVEAAGKPEGSEAKLNLGDAERRKATACGGWSKKYIRFFFHFPNPVDWRTLPERTYETQ